MRKKIINENDAPKIEKFKFFYFLNFKTPRCTRTRAEMKKMLEINSNNKIGNEYVKVYIKQAVNCNINVSMEALKTNFNLISKSRVINKSLFNFITSFQAGIRLIKKVGKIT